MDNIKLRCIWNDSCLDDAKEMPFFNGPDVPICSKHIECHKRVMELYLNGTEIEEALDIVNKEFLGS